MRSRRGMLAGALLAGLAVLTAVGLLTRPGPVPGPRSSSSATASGEPASPSTPSDVPPPATATYPDGPFEATLTREPTAGASQAKLWFNDGAWWAILREPASQEIRIARLDWPTQHWVDTGTLVDERLRVATDVVWDGAHLLVLSAGDRPTESQAVRLSRFHYDKPTGRYVIDPDFPIALTASGVAGPAIARDSKGVLWMAYLDQGVVVVRHTVSGDLDWTARAVLPADGADGTARTVALAADGTRVAVVWSRVGEATLRAAVHLDTAAADAWTSSATVVDGLGAAPGGFSVRGVTGPEGARLLVAFEIATDAAATNPLAPGAVVMVLEPDGSWTHVQLGRAKDHLTAPILAIDAARRVVYAIAASTSTGQVTFKASPLDRLVFEAGPGNPIVATTSDPSIRNPTTTSQTVDAEAGFVVLAADDSTGRYLHGVLSTAGGLPAAGAAAPPPPAPVANILIHDTFDPWAVGTRSPAGWVASDQGGGAGRLTSVTIAGAARGLQVLTTSATGSIRACKAFAPTDAGVVSVVELVRINAIGSSDATLLSVRGPGGEAVSIRVTRHGLVAYYLGGAKITTKVAFQPGRTYRLTATIRLEDADLRLGARDGRAHGRPGDGRQVADGGPDGDRLRLRPVSRRPLPLRHDRRHRGTTLMQVLVTGVAGFVGSHLAEASDRGRPRRRRASTPSSTTTRGRSRRRTSPGCGRPALHDARARPPDRRPGAARSTASTRSSTRRRWPACRGAGRTSSATWTATCSGPQRLLEAAPGRRRPPVRPHLDLVGLRPRRRRRRDAPDPADLAVRRDQARGRAPRPRLRRRRSASRPRSCATSRSSARASGPTWPTTSSSRRCSTAGRSPSSATASRPARTPSWPMPCAGTIAAIDGGRDRRDLQHRRRRVDHRQRGHRDARRGDRRRADDRARRGRGSATSATPGRTRPKPGRRSATARPSGRTRGFGRRPRGSARSATDLGRR